MPFEQAESSGIKSKRVQNGQIEALSCCWSCFIVLSGLHGPLSCLRRPKGLTHHRKRAVRRHRASPRRVASSPSGCCGVRAQCFGRLSQWKDYQIASCRIINGRKSMVNPSRSPRKRSSVASRGVYRLQVIGREDLLCIRRRWNPAHRPGP